MSTRIDVSLQSCGPNALNIYQVVEITPKPLPTATILVPCKVPKMGRGDSKSRREKIAI